MATSEDSKMAVDTAFLWRRHLERASPELTHGGQPAAT